MLRADIRSDTMPNVKGLPMVKLLHDKRRKCMDNYRWDIPRDCSMAYLLFRQHHIQFNNMYWAYLYGTATLGREAKKAKGIFESPSEYLVNLKGPNVNYSAVSCWDNWWKYFEDFEIKKFCG